MDIEQMKKEHGTPEKLEYYAFMWSMARMALAAVALLLGGIPLVFKIVGFGAYSTVGSLLNLSWVISGVAAAYLLYLWFKNNKQVFGGNDTKDTVAFFVMVVSGCNLGLAGLGSGNIGMQIFSGQLFLYVGAAIYIAALYYLYTRWVSNGKRLFGSGTTSAPQGVTASSVQDVTDEGGQSA